MVIVRHSEDSSSPVLHTAVGRMRYSTNERRSLSLHFRSSSATDQTRTGKGRPKSAKAVRTPMLESSGLFLSGRGRIKGWKVKFVLKRRLEATKGARLYTLKDR